MQRVLTFLKRHYEKLILALVLIGLVVVGVTLPKQIKDANDTPPPPPNPSDKSGLMAPMEVGPLVAAMQQVTNPPPLTLSGEHNLFNPVVWKRKSNGDLVKILKTGADALIVSNIVPEYMKIALDRPGGDGYFMYVVSPAGKRTNEYVKLNEKAPRTKLYEITGTNGSGDDTKLELQLLDTGEKVSVTEKEPYERVEGYIADLWYQPDLKSYPKKHVNDTFDLDGDQYKVVAITNDAVTVQATSTTEKTTINWNGKPGAARRP